MVFVPTRKRRMQLAVPSGRTYEVIQIWALTTVYQWLILTHKDAGDDGAAFFTASYHAVKTALSNPTESLRAE